MEFGLIERIRARVATRDDVVLGIGDDAALLQPPPGAQLAVATDTLNVGVHFPPGTAAADIGWKALAVNLSDLAAMGAEPAWCTLSLSLLEPDPSWLDGFLDGFLDLAARHRIALVGGDTTRGPLSVCVTVHGLVAPGRALRRDGAVAGDDIWVSGGLGDAAAALALLQAADEPVVVACEAGPLLAADPDGGSGRLASLRPRLDRPTPRVELGLQLAGMAHAAIDISDGLIADLGHICQASRLAADVEVDRLPCSPARMELMRLAVTCSTRPISPIPNRRANSITAGLKHSMWPGMRETPAFRAASTIRRASAYDGARGFSTSTAQPASMAHRATSAWRPAGTATMTASRRSEASIASWLV